MTGTALGTIVRFAVWLFPVSELALGFLSRAKSTEAAVDDRGSKWMMWVVILVAMFLAVQFAGVRFGAMAVAAAPRLWTTLALLAGGLGLRWYAILTLGRLFTTNVAIHRGHEVVTAGPYRYVRHPSYTGMLIAFVGLGVYFGNWISLALVIVPITLVTLYRIKVEEAVLARALGEAYQSYAARTKRLIPGVI